MDFFRNLSLRWKLAFSFSVIMILMIGVATAVYSSLGKLLESNKWVNHTYEAIEFGEKITGSLVNMETGLRGFLVAGNPEFLEPFNNGQKEFQSLISEAKLHVQDNAKQVDRLTQVASIETQWQSEHVNVAKTLRAEVNKGAEAAKNFKTISSRTVGKEKFDGFRAALADLNTQFIQSNDVKGQELIQHILMDMLNQETGQRGYLLSGIEASLEPYHTGIEALSGHLAILTSIIDSAYDREGVKEKLQSLKNLVAQWKKDVVLVGINLKKQTQTNVTTKNDVTAFVLQGTGKKYFDQSRGIISALSNEFRQSNDHVADGLLTTASKHMVDMETGYRGFLLTGKESSLEPYQSGEVGFKATMDQLFDLVNRAYSVETVKMQLETITALSSDWKVQAAEPEIQARKEMNQVKSTLEDISAFIEQGIGKKYMDEMRGILNAFIEEEAALIQIRNSEQQSTAEFTTNVTLLGTLIALISGGLLVSLITRSIMRSLTEAVEVANKIADDDLTSVIKISSSDEPGQLMKSLDSMQSKLKNRIETERAAAAEIERVKQSLDNVSGNVMIVDVDLNVIYMNNAISELLRSAETELKKDLPNFDFSTLIGSNIGVLCDKKPELLPALTNLSNSYTTDMEIGGLYVQLTANPVTDESNKQLGVVLEWLNRTDEVAVEKEVQTIVDASLAGDLGQRVDLNGKHGFFKTLSHRINSLLDVSEQVINETIQVLSAMAEGDLSKTISSDYKGSFEKLKTDANTTIAKLTEITKDIRDSSEIVLKASLEIAEGNTNLSQRTEEQASSLEETASSIEQMTVTVKQNTDNAFKASQIADSAREKAEEGGSVIGNTISAMNEITSSSEKIANIITVIDEIAFQTNLLALNAAVEAARAGEQGRGFAVVASEVGSLAGRSANSAKEIKELIQDSVTKIEEGSRLVSESGKNLKDIIASVNEVSIIVSEIATASQEQSDGSLQINKAVSQIDELTQHNAALVEQAAVASESMGEQAGKLNELVSFFKMDGEGNGSAGFQERYSQQNVVSISPNQESQNDSSLFHRIESKEQEQGKYAQNGHTM